MTDGATPSIERELELAGLPALHRLAWLEVDLAALMENARLLRGLAGPDARLGLVTKANAYGHGMEMASLAGTLAGADCLFLATLDEALRLRAFGLATDLLVAYPVATDPGTLAEAAAHAVDVTAGNRDATVALLTAWRAAAPSCGGRELRVHIEVDTGMSRGGSGPAEAGAVARAVAAEPGVHLAGVWTHLARPDEPDHTRAQVATFERTLEVLRAAGIEPPLRHVASSGALLAGVCPPYDMVRVGLSFYGMVDPGVQPSARAAGAVAGLHPALVLTTRAVRIEDVAPGERVGYGGTWEAPRASRIATLPVGYGDGYARAYSPGASALVRGTRAPVVGVVSMDSLTVDVTGVSGVGPGDEFVLLGAQGAERITADELATIRRSINYEVTTSLGDRLVRVYRDGSDIVAVSRPGLGITFSPRAPTGWGTPR